MLKATNYNNIDGTLLMQGSKYLDVTDVTVTKVYKDGNETDILEASRFKVRRPSDGETFFIKIKDAGTAATDFKFPCKATFTNLHGKFYVNRRGFLDISVQAEGVEAVE